MGAVMPSHLSAAMNVVMFQPVGHFTNQPLALKGSSAKPGHSRADTGFIQKDKMFRGQ
jgi:hypothetical protein